MNCLPQLLDFHCSSVACTPLLPTTTGAGLDSLLLSLAVLSSAVAIGLAANTHRNERTLARALASVVLLCMAVTGLESDLLFSRLCSICALGCFAESFVVNGDHSVVLVGAEAGAELERIYQEALLRPDQQGWDSDDAVMF